MLCRSTPNPHLLLCLQALEKLHGMFYSYSFHHQDSP